VAEEQVLGDVYTPIRRYISPTNHLLAYMYDTLMPSLLAVRLTPLLPRRSNTGVNASLATALNFRWEPLRELLRERASSPRSIEFRREVVYPSRKGKLAWAEARA
jgi:hypothetical protein